METPAEGRNTGSAAGTAGRSGGMSAKYWALVNPGKQSVKKNQAREAARKAKAKAESEREEAEARAPPVARIGVHGAVGGDRGVGVDGSPRAGKRRRVDSEDKDDVRSGGSEAAAAAILHGDGGAPATSEAEGDGVCRCADNEVIVEEITRLTNWHTINKHKRDVDHAKIKNLGIVCGHIRKLDRPTFELSDCELLAFTHLGKKTLEKIREIEQFGFLRRIDNVVTPEDKAVMELRRVHGIGAREARLLVEGGILTIEELRQAVKTNPALREELRADALTGLEFFDDYQQRMPRKVVESIAGKVIEIAKRLSPCCETHICGSYRRGEETSGDVDVLISADTAAEIDLPAIVAELKRAGVVTHDLTNSGDDGGKEAEGKWDEQTGSKWMGLVVDVGSGDRTHRRIDIMTCPRFELPFQLIYLTGSEFLQRYMRTVAGRLGWSMSQHGFRIRKGDPLKEAPRIQGGTMYEGPFHTERDVFDALGVEYLEPHERRQGNRKLSLWPEKYRLSTHSTKLQ